MIHQPLRDILASRYLTYCVGSLPFTDSVEAVQFVLDRNWIVPFWPELPKKSEGESMLARSEKALASDWDGYTPEEASGLYEIRKALADRNKSLPILKCQLMGPLTHALFSDHLSGNLLDRLQVTIGACIKQIEWQREFLAELDTQLLFVLDEPGLIEWKNIDEQIKQKIRDVYSYIFVQVGEGRSYLGLHFCSAFDVEFLKFPFELLSFDVLEQGFGKIFPKANRYNWSDIVTRRVVIVPGVAQSALKEGFKEEISLANLLNKKIVNYLKKISNTKASNVLWSASCGHADGSAGWLDALYHNSSVIEDVATVHEKR